MIEVVYNEEKKKPVGNEGFFHIPKNIRQIGETDPQFKIYIEDYAYHYLDRIADDMSGGKVALLLGQTNWADGVTYVFIKSAFCLKDMEADENHIPFSEEVWKQAGEMSDVRFKDQKVVGWFFTKPECSLELTEVMHRTHMNYFAGNDKVFLLMEPVDSEEAFYRYENGKICRQRGYYLYYERNDAMQEFMIEENQNQPMEHKGVVPDKAVKDFREIIAHKKDGMQEEKAREKKNPGKDKSAPYFMYATAAAAVILALALGTNYLNGYGKLKDTKGLAEKVVTQIRQTSDTVEAGGDLLEEAAGDDVNGKITWDSVRENTEKSSDTMGILSGSEKADEDWDVLNTEGTLDKKEMSEEKEASREKPEKEKSTSKTQEEEGQAAAESDSSEMASSNMDRGYVIQPGDTLTSISRDIYGNIGMISKICEKNGISKETVIYPGEKILLP